MKKGLTILLTMLLCAACTFKANGVYTDDTTEEYELYDYYIDSYGNEGIVAYIYSSSYYKYIIVISADEAYLPWGPMGERVYKSDSVSSSALRNPSFGVAMHQAMYSIGIDRYPAQAWCNRKNGENELPRAGSWRLPSYYELRTLFGEEGKNVQNINNALNGIGGTPLTTTGNDDKYWTCVEDIDHYVTINGQESDYDRENRAIIISPDIYTFGNKDRWLKKNYYRVRAIKYVYYQYR